MGEALTYWSVSYAGKQERPAGAATESFRRRAVLDPEDKRVAYRRSF